MKIRPSFVFDGAEGAMLELPVMKPSGLSIAVLGDGGWGTTLALHLHRQGQSIRWWSAFAENARTVNRCRENPKFLPGIRLARGLKLETSLPEVVSSADLIVLAVPSQFLRGVVHRLRGHLSRRQAFVSVAKGIETGSLKRMSQVIQEELGPVPVAALSGPNIALEIAGGQPASSVAASASGALAKKVQHVFMNERLRIYTSSDVVGVELGGALKNPLAIAAGIVDGLKLGSNTKAALITRGLAEMSRLGVAMGARRETFAGLSGLGDLVTTCLSGRNHWLGVNLGQGKPLRRILASTATVIEGVETSKAAVRLGKMHGIELPIIEQVYAILFKDRSPRTALNALMLRRGKSE